MPGAFPLSSRPPARRLAEARVGGASGAAGRVAGNPACGVAAGLAMTSRPEPAGKRGPPLPDFRGQAHSKSTKRLTRKNGTDAQTCSIPARSVPLRSSPKGRRRARNDDRKGIARCGRRPWASESVNLLVFRIPFGIFPLHHCVERMTPPMRQRTIRRAVECRSVDAFGRP